MTIIDVVSGVLGLGGIAFGFYFAMRLREWELHLRHTRIAVAYKNKIKMDPPLIEWLTWAQSLSKDERARGRAVFKMGGTTVAILKPLPKEHGKTTVTTKKTGAEK